MWWKKRDFKRNVAAKFFVARQSINEWRKKRKEWNKIWSRILNSTKTSGSVATEPTKMNKAKKREYSDSDVKSKKEESIMYDVGQCVDVARIIYFGRFFIPVNSIHANIRRCM